MRARLIDRRRPRWPIRVLSLLAAVALALLVGEALLRWGVAARPEGELYYRDSSGHEATPADAMARGLVVPVDAAENPRGRLRFAPDAAFSICYRQSTDAAPGWLDRQGCVDVRLNPWGLRERAELAPDAKPAGERRIVCVGDSLTFGWGVRVEDCWVRGVEDGLRRGDDGVRTVNCGAAGAQVVDEYWWAFRRRFARFLPDCVVVTLSLNDLLPSSGLCVLTSRNTSCGLLVLDRLRLACGRDPYELDPRHDWVASLLQASRAELEASGLCNHDRPFDAMWSQGAPQAALLEFRGWCREHGVPLLVVLWPFLQGTGPGRVYPFTRMHELVADFCRGEAIAFVDLLPAFAPTPAAELWVSPLDLHPNDRAHAIAVRQLLPALRAHCGF